AVGEQNKSSALAIAKSEAATTKQIDQLSVLIQTMTKAFDDKISDLKDRFNRLEGHGTGISAAWGYLVGAVAVFGAIMAFVLRRYRGFEGHGRNDHDFRRGGSPDAVFQVVRGSRQVRAYRGDGPVCLGCDPVGLQRRDVRAYPGVRLLRELDQRHCGCCWHLRVHSCCGELSDAHRVYTTRG